MIDEEYGEFNMAEKKHSPFYVLRILQEYSDEHNILTANRILSRLESDYDLVLERRTLYSNIDILRQAGYAISDFKHNGKGYYLLSREFTKGEILLLCNAVHASHFISDEQSSVLISKLLKFLSRQEQSEFRNSVYLPNRKKTENKALLKNIEILSTAIAEGRKVRFSYVRHDAEKNEISRRKEPYVLEPRFIVFADSRPYLIATNPKYTSFSHYRIDRMKRLIELEEKAEPLPEKRVTEAYEYAENKLFMFAGEDEWISLKCEERIMDQMIDIFGPQMKTIPAEEGYFIARVKCERTGILFLAQQYMDAVEIVDPPELRDEMRNRLRTAQEKYSV